MGSKSTDTDFTVWGIDHTAYGPVELPTLMSWVEGERVTSDTWVFHTKNGAWQKAAEVPELETLFRSKCAGTAGGTTSTPGFTTVEPKVLRRVKILASLSDAQITRFAEFMEARRIPQWQVIVKQGDPGDAMYLILEGEFRVRVTIAGKETILATLGVGDFFGDISLFDHGPRSADVVANSDGLILRVSTEGFSKLAAQAPDVATPFLLAVGKTLAARIRQDNKRYSDAVKFARAAL